METPSSPKLGGMKGGNKKTGAQRFLRFTMNVQLLADWTGGAWGFRVTLLRTCITLGVEQEV